MRRTWALCRKELQLYFFAPTSYIAFAIYFLVCGFFFSLYFLQSLSLDVVPIIGNTSFIYLFIIPLLTMRLVSDELRQGTDELLLTSPASITEIIVGKYLAALIVQGTLVVGTLIYPLIMSAFGKLDMPILWLSFLSMFLLGSALMAVGLFASTTSANQMVAGVVAFSLMILLWMIEFMGGSSATSGKDWLNQFSIIGRTVNMQKGVFDLSDVLFYVSFILVFIFLSIQLLDRKRWR
ncbi:ABC transporter permease [Paenibacillus psychroresistens]|uniref:ABC transporter permease n=1 Tax=Paenibacillus psychroresistens TaxID=1778678 RepID=A0A6B8RCM3_9BACL|nr:ABC transporter permease [Paenibacillus psychroresistens]QGQ93564.1 ABC transporter permease [Paenibacillus psychroresistens]